MRLAAGTLLLVFAVFINSIELISSEPETLEDLFPGYKDVLPPLEKLPSFDYDWPNFDTFGGKRMVDEFNFYMKRLHIVFGYETIDFIEDPCRLFNLTNVFIVFDTNINEWITVPRNLTRQLGAGRRFSLVVTRDELIAKHKLRSTNPVYVQAHIKAIKYANALVDIEEKKQTELLDKGYALHYYSIPKIQEEYHRAYTHEFSNQAYRQRESSSSGKKESHS